VGLGESIDPASVLYECLSPGDVRRTLTAGNLAQIDSNADRFMKATGDTIRIYRRAGGLSRRHEAQTDLGAHQPGPGFPDRFRLRGRAIVVQRDASIALMKMLIARDVPGWRRKPPG
jgi:hypothetical protein